jgi:hypothetical protein
MINPFGVVYNPISVKRSLEILLDEKVYEAKDLDYFNGLWYSWDHHSSFSNPDQQKALQKINAGIAVGAAQLKKASFILFTYGTAWTYRLRDNGRIVCNCHKKPSSAFDHELLEVDEIVREYEELYNKAKEINPSLRFIFTVSPVRHWKEGAHGNQISKSVLLLAIEKIREIYGDKFDYFPSYELLLDDLRDYRFYADDLLHPNKLAIDYIWEKFGERYFEKDTLLIIKSIERLIKASMHRFSFPGSKDHQKFLKEELNKLEEIENTYPFINVSNFRKHFTEELKFNHSE